MDKGIFTAIARFKEACSVEPNTLTLGRKQFNNLVDACDKYSLPLHDHKYTISFAGMNVIKADVESFIAVGFNIGMVA